jgi:lysophospholipase L1-like esterase
MKRLIFLAIFMTIFVSSIRADISPQDARIIGIIAQGSVIQGPYVLYIGDSIVQGFPYSSPCGAKFINGGVSGTGIKWWLDNLPVILTVIKPKMVIIHLGGNDARIPVDQSVVNGWGDDLITIAYMISGAGAIPAFMTLTPYEQGDTLHDLATFQFINSQIISVRNRWLLPFRDVYTEYSNAQGFMPPGWTTDRVHPNGYFYTLIQEDVINVIQQGYYFTGHTCTDR